MKTAFVLLALFSSALLLAQPADNAKLKPFLDKFWQYMDEIKKVEAGVVKPATGAVSNNAEIKSEVPVGADNNVTRLKIIADNAKRQIEHIKKRDPNYDVSKMEAMLKPYFDAKQSEVDTHNARIAASSWHNTDDGCYGLFEKNTTTEFRTSGKLEEDINTHIAQLEAYNKRLDNILKNRMAGVETCHDYIKSRTDDGGVRVAEFFQKLDKTDDALLIKSIYRELLGEEAYWNAARLLYPDITGAAELHGTIQKKLQALGGLEGILAKAKAKKAERLKNLFMPKAVVVNANMEAEFKEAFNNGGWGESIVKINLLTKEWTIVRNSLTGAILCRTQQAAIVARQKQGNCVLYTYTIKQQYTGGGNYSSISSYYGHDVWETEFVCENAK